MSKKLFLVRKPDLTLRNWREMFGTSLSLIAKYPHGTSSIVSDIESGIRVPCLLDEAEHIPLVLSKIASAHELS